MGPRAVSGMEREGGVEGSRGGVETEFGVGRWYELEKVTEDEG